MNLNNLYLRIENDVITPPVAGISVISLHKENSK